MFAFEKEKSKRILGVIMVSVGMALAAGKLLDDSCHQTVRSHRAHEKDRSLGCVSTANSSSTTSGLKADIQRDCGNRLVQMVLPMAEMIGWLRKGVGELIRQAGLQLMDLLMQEEVREPDSARVYRANGSGSRPRSR